jgi:hypothetical protein
MARFSYNRATICGPLGPAEAPFIGFEDKIPLHFRPRFPAWKKPLKKNAWTNMYLASDQFKRFVEAQQSQFALVVTALGLNR